MTRFDGCFRACGLVLCVMAGVFFGVWKGEFYAGAWMTTLLGLVLGLTIETFKTKV